MLKKGTGSERTVTLLGRFRAAARCLSPFSTGLLIAVTLAFATTARAADEPAPPEPAPKYKIPALIRFEGEITPQSKAYLLRKLETAREEGADLVIVEIHSPGGMVEPSFDSAFHLADLGWARTVAYVPDRAYSGAAVIALGCDEIVMRPRAQLGDVGMIFLDEASGHFQYVDEKLTAPWKEKLRDLAAAKGRPPALAEKMMARKIEVYEYRNNKTSESRLMTPDDAEAAGRDDWTKGKLVPEARKDTFLTVNGQRAVELGLAAATVDDRAALAARYGFDPESLIVYERTRVDVAVDFFNHPVITVLLFIIGLVCLYIEFSAPGIGLGGMLAGLCFALFYWSRFLGGTAVWLEVVLFLVGVGFLAVELFLLPGFGLIGLSGLLLMLTSVVLASQDFVIPQTSEQWGQLARTSLILLGSATGLVGIAALVGRRFKSIPILGHLRLEPPAPDAAPATPDSRRTEIDLPPAAGALGVAETPLRPAGKARFAGRIVDVITDGVFIPRGAQVEVVEADRYRILVREHADNAA
jgi:membrane-bound serine protease (ClpP class)